MVYFTLWAQLRLYSRMFFWLQAAKPLPTIYFRSNMCNQIQDVEIYNIAQNLQPDLVDEACLYSCFKAHGEVLSVKIARDQNGHSRGFGFVQYKTEDCAEQARKQLNKTCFVGQRLSVTKFRPSKVSHSASAGASLICSSYTSVLFTQHERETSFVSAITSDCCRILSICHKTLYL